MPANTGRESSQDTPPLISRGGPAALHRGVYEVALRAASDLGNPYFDVECQVAFTRPDASEVVVDGFYDGAQCFKARAYCDMPGDWQWRSLGKGAGLTPASGAFRVVPSPLKGKLRKHPDDPRQFAYENGEWFLHIGDTGYRYLTDTEPRWQEYVDQAARMGATKIRTWFCRGRGDVQALFTTDRAGLDLAYWQEIDRRLIYALERHPGMNFQLIPYGEDTEELLRYESGERASRLVARYAQARFSALPNIQWCISNDREIVAGGPCEGRRMPREIIRRIGRDMAAREPWKTLLTNHQSRFKGYDFVDEPWSDIITLEDMDQVHGGLIAEYRAKRPVPVVLDEDRYECYRSPKHKRYFFRRLMWASLLSGGHATYGGLLTYEQYDGELRGMQGYYDAVEAGKLAGGADDFGHIHKFFHDTGLTLVGMIPDDTLAGSAPERCKCLRGERTLIVYLANPDDEAAEKADAGLTAPTVQVDVPERFWSARWFDPTKGDWQPLGTVRGGRQAFTAPGPGDWVLLFRSDERAS